MEKKTYRAVLVNNPAEEYEINVRSRKDSRVRVDRTTCTYRTDRGTVYRRSYEFPRTMDYDNEMISVPQSIEVYEA